MMTSPDTEEIPQFTEEVVKRAIKDEKHKAHGIDWITDDLINLGGGGGGGKLFSPT